MQHKIDRDIAKRRAHKDLEHRVVIFKEQKMKDGLLVPGSTYCGKVIESYPNQVVRCHFRFVLSEDEEGDDYWIALERTVEWRGPITDSRIQILEVTVDQCRKRPISTSQP